MHSCHTTIGLCATHETTIDLSKSTFVPIVVPKQNGGLGNIDLNIAINKELLRDDFKQK